MRAIFDDNGKLVRMERETSKDDEDVADSYMDYLKDQFKELDEKKVLVSNDLKDRIDENETYTSKEEMLMYMGMQKVLEQHK